MDNEIRRLSESVVRLQEKVSTLETTIKQLVSHAEFTPVKMIAYGLATAVLSSVMMAVLAKVLTK
ncbi:hypothetical protein EX011_21450 [Salmonella enterica]|nr:hypothetical protein [Salmonella enterica]EAW2493095.1 hypothetical protein [Salmonella enterica subsp. enterica]HAV7961470.1 hypothetical protein [Escherichia coli]EBL7042091.1 hypothetical protein [Salmonella enterica]EHQ9605818.1 hypothetical protein [Salmonella enterica]